MVRQSHFEVGEDFLPYETLLGTADLLGRHEDLTVLFRELTERLRQVVDCEQACFALYDSDKCVMKIYTPADPRPQPVEVPADQSLSGWVWHTQMSVLLPQETIDAPCFPKALDWLKGKGLASYCLLPLMSASKCLGAMGGGSFREGAYRTKEMAFLGRVAELVAIAIDNATSRTDLQGKEQRLRMVFEICAALNSAADLHGVFPTIARAIQGAMRPEMLGLALYEKASHSFRIYMMDALAEHFSDFACVPFEYALPAETFTAAETRIFNYEDLTLSKSPFVRTGLEQGIRSAVTIPLIHGATKLGAMVLCSSGDSVLPPADIALLEEISAHVAAAFEREQSNGVVRAETCNKELEDPIPEGQNGHFVEIIGGSPQLKRTLIQVETVASTKATVLILGETGTGKELIARAIHRRGSRSDESFVKLNCAAIPNGLLESELFGHEKGAFTGAISQKLGRLEVANKGTLFLDEVGDIPMELQPKLLRVLQDQEFERLGGTKTIRVDVRLIAATNKNLAQSVADHEFRSDLYYRLNVFPITSPPLRERSGDIELLVRYFVQKFSRRMGKRIEEIPVSTMEMFTKWHWPGNVRELENLIERSVILTDGNVLQAPLIELPSPEPSIPISGSLERMEREHIVRALRESGGVIAGLNGAAARLGLKRTTLQSRMHRLGIGRHEYEN